MQEIIDNLQKSGFTLNEARVYQALLALGETKAGPLCRKLDIHSSHIYPILDSLIKKGIVSFKIYKNYKIYKPNRPETLRTLFTQKKNELSDMEKAINQAIKEIKILPKKKETLSDYQYFEGRKGIKSMWIELNNAFNPKDTIDVYTGTVESFAWMTPFYLDVHHKERVKKKVNERMILPKGATKEAKLRKKIGMIDIRYQEKDNEGQFTVHNDIVIIEHNGRKENQPRGFLIKDEVLAKTFKMIFNKLWDQSEK